MSVFYQSWKLANMIHNIRLCTGMTDEEARRVLFQLGKWSQSHLFGIEQAYNLYIRDIQYHGQPNMTSEAFINDQK